MQMIFAVDRQWNIGYDGDMLFKIADDLARFREITMGHVLLMGRKTFDSLPNGALPHRINAVVTRDPHWSAENALAFSGIDAFDEWRRREGIAEEDVFLIGGGDLVKQLLDRVQSAYITKVDRLFLPADTLIPNLDADPAFRLTDVGPWLDDHGLPYRYIQYERVTP